METHPSAIANWERRAAERIRRLFAPIPRLFIDEWADQYRFLSETNSAEPGPWSTDRVPFIRGILRAVTDPTVDVIVYKKPAQVSYTEGVIGNTIGYHVHQRPRSMLVVQPSKEDAEDWSKDKLQGLIDATPVVRDRLGVGRSDTILSKTFPGGILKIVGGTSPKGLRRTSAPFVIVDEADGLPASAGEEGSPVDIVLKRLTTYWDGKALIGSTPTNEGESVISELYELTDQRRFFVPCPHCGGFQVLRWGRKEDPFGVKFEYRTVGRRRIVDPASVCYLCEHCACEIDERQKYAMVASGEWRATALESATPGWVGFHLNALVSPFEKVRWHRLVQEWLDAQDDHDKLKVFVNTRLGEEWKVPGTAVAATELEARAQRWVDAAERRIEVPAGVGVLTAAVDVQDNRLEVLVKGWGADEESWNIMHHRIYGDPSVRLGPVWQELEALRTRIWHHESGARMRISAMCIDSGFLKNEVYAYVALHQKERVYAVKGGDTEQREPIKRSKTKNKAGVNLVLVGTVPMKDTLFPRLLKRIRDGAAPPGYIHFRAADPTWSEGSDSEYFAQFEREKLVWERVPGGGRRRAYRNISGKPVEAIDLEVYNLTALHLLGPVVRAHLGTFADQLRRPQGSTPAAAAAAPRKKRRVRSKGITV